ncbi:dimethylarginine dimethylaminohydrolase family protein [Psychromonas hadalis]|uniref:dimethylarginine dimethylaminohydrolase family protein n=1 Tax=Psychromonas hadalis TaxID=211669 RepID=UPI0003B4515F|nr:arginine deiminase family protein [Psychromonas hadalis]
MSSGYVHSATGRLKQVLLCPPDYLALTPINKIAKDWLNKGVSIDSNKCLLEHQQLISFYEKSAIKVSLLAPSEGLSSQLFSRDFAFMLKEGAVIGRFKEPLRQAETLYYKNKLIEMGIPIIATCSQGVIEGGDFWMLDEKTLVIGCLQRSNQAGIKNIRQQLKPLGYEIISVEAKAKYLHLDMIFNIVDTKVAITYWPALPTSFQNHLIKENYDLIKIAEHEVFLHFCNLQTLGDKRVISLESNVQVNKQLEARGFTVFKLNCSEILKAGGGPHCMTFPIRRNKKT